MSTIKAFITNHPVLTYFTLTFAISWGGVLALVPITTPAASPQSNGMSEPFANTLRRDYIVGADLSTAAIVLDQIPAWIADYNVVAPYSALGFRSPQQYRDEAVTGSRKC